MTDSPNRVRKELGRLTSHILDPKFPAHSLRPKILEMTELLYGLGSAPIALQEDIAKGETRTASGLAISPKMAAMCAEDYVRTIQFIRGTHAAILDIRERFPNRPARILYVGCGPCATLAIPLMAILPASDATFTLLDIHADSIESVKSIAGGLGLAECITHFETIDAATYRVDAENMPDIILMEIIQACLESEPQVAVARHLLPQAPDAIPIPEEVNVDLVLVDPSCEFNLDGKIPERNRIPVAAVFTLNRESVDSWKNISATRLPAEDVCLPDSIEPQFQPMLFTRIRVYKDCVLKDYDSGLTYPRPIPQETGAKPSDMLQFHYELGSQPGLRCQMGKPTN